jgi:hypothetical protein
MAETDNLKLALTGSNEYVDVEVLKKSSIKCAQFFTSCFV